MTRKSRLVAAGFTAMTLFIGFPIALIGADIPKTQIDCAAAGVATVEVIDRHGELIVKPLREADRALDSESANGSYSTWFAI